MSDNVKTVEQFLETARLETGDVWMDNHDWRHLIAIVDQLAADLAAAKKERDAAYRRVEQLSATLDGDPHMTATPEQRRAWRVSAVRYADKAEAELAAARADAKRLAKALRGKLTLCDECNEPAAFSYQDANGARIHGCESHKFGLDPYYGNVDALQALASHQRGEE